MPSLSLAQFNGLALSSRGLRVNSQMRVLAEELGGPFGLAVA